MPKKYPKYWICPNCESINPYTLKICEVCGKDIPIELLPPTIEYFNSSATKVNENDKVVLSWSIINAKYVFLNGKRVAASGNLEIVAKDRFIIKASNANGSAERCILINIIHNPIIISCKVASLKPLKGVPCDIKWESKYVEKVRIGKDFYPANGKYTFTPKKNESVRVYFIGNNGKEIYRSVKIELPPINIINLTVKKPNIWKREKGKVSWSSENVSHVMIEGEKYNPNDTFIPPKSGYITLEFIGNNGLIEKRTIYVIVKNKGCLKIFLIISIFMSILIGSVWLNNSEIKIEKAKPVYTSSKKTAEQVQKNKKTQVSSQNPKNNQPEKMNNKNNYNESQNNEVKSKKKNIKDDENKTNNNVINSSENNKNIEEQERIKKQEEIEREFKAAEMDEYFE